MRSILCGVVLAVPLSLPLFVACSSDPTPRPSALADGGDAPGDAKATIPVDPNSPIVTSAPVTLTRETLAVDGNARTYLLAVPIHFDAGKRYPLVLSFHGDGGSGASMQSTWPIEATTREDAIVAYPDGVGNAWDLYSATDSNADMAFVRALIPAIATKWSVDTNRVLGFGYSKGAFFVNQLACRFQGLFKAIASHEGGAPNEEAIGGMPDKSGQLICSGGPIAAFVFHGGSDTTVDVPSGRYDSQYWAHVNGCDEDNLVDLDPAPCQVHRTCPSGKPSTFCLIPGQGHVVWARGVEASWTFFTALP